MNTQTYDYQDIIQVQPRGGFTIPRRFRTEEFESGKYLRLSKIQGKIILEPVQIIGYPVRKYTDNEVGEFFALDDKLSLKVK